MSGPATAAAAGDGGVLDRIPLSATLGTLVHQDRPPPEEEEEAGGGGGGCDPDDAGEASQGLPDLVVHPYWRGSGTGQRHADPYRPLDYSGPATTEGGRPARPEDVFGVAVVATGGGEGGGADLPTDSATAKAGGGGGGSSGEEDDDDDGGGDGGSLAGSDSESGDVSDVPSGGSSRLSDDDGPGSDADDGDGDDPIGGGFGGGGGRRPGRRRYASKEMESFSLDARLDSIGDEDEVAKHMVLMASDSLTSDSKLAAMRDARQKQHSREGDEDEDGDGDGDGEGDGEEGGGGRRYRHDDQPTQKVALREGGRGGVSKIEVMKRKRDVLMSHAADLNSSGTSEDDDEDDDEGEQLARAWKKAKGKGKVYAMKRLGKGARVPQSLRPMLTQPTGEADRARGSAPSVTVTVLGTAQDGGLPQPGCYLPCCEAARADPSLRRMPIALGVAGRDGTRHLIEASRFLGEQLDLWKISGTFPEDEDGSGGGRAARKCPVNSVTITHAHLGHVDGLGLFGREVINSEKLPLNCSETFKMRALEKNPVWSKMVEQGCIEPHVWTSEEEFSAAGTAEAGFMINAIPIPHRAELSDTHALLLESTESGRRLLFLPDHDDWDQTLKAVGCASVQEWLVDKLDVDIALLDGTFFNPGSELGNVRNVAEIPHPPVAETLVKLGKKPGGEKKDRRFIFCHLNHTNPLCNPDSTERKLVEEAGWEIASEGDVFVL